VFPNELSEWPVDVRDVRLSDDNLAVIWKRGHLIRNKYVDHRDVLLDLTLMTGPSSVKKAVENHGPLWLCEHGLPYRHSQISGLVMNFAQVVKKHNARCYPLGYNEPEALFIAKTKMVGSVSRDEEFAEPIESWLELAKLTRLYVEAIQHLKRNNTKELEAEARRIELIGLTEGFTPGGSSPDEKLHNHFDGVATIAVDLIHTGGSRPEYYLDQDYQLSIEDTNPNVMSELGRQMLNMILNMDRLTECSICNRVYARERRVPKSGQANYCSAKCRTAGATNRQKKRRSQQVKPR
jgi:hypothetical protein